MTAPVAALTRRGETVKKLKWYYKKDKVKYVDLGEADAVASNCS